MAAPEGFLFVPDFLNQEKQLALMGALVALDYQHDTFRGQRLKRGYVQFGYEYVSTGRKLKPVVEIPDFLAAVAAQAMPHCPTGTEFNQCIVTRYPSGSASAGTRTRPSLVNASWE